MLFIASNFKSGRDNLLIQSIELIQKVVCQLLITVKINYEISSWNINLASISLQPDFKLSLKFESMQRKLKTEDVGMVEVKETNQQKYLSFHQIIVSWFSRLTTFYFVGLRRTNSFKVADARDTLASYRRKN